MLKMIFLLARRMFIRLLLVLLPLGLFMFLAQAIPLSPLQSLLLLVPVIAFEVWLVIRHLLPVMGELVTKTLYSSNITTDEEVLVEASRRMLKFRGSPGRSGIAGTLPEGESGAGAFLAHGIQPAERYAPVRGFRQRPSERTGIRRVAQGGTGLCSCTR